MLSKALECMRSNTPSTVQFNSFTSQEIRELSACEITNSLNFTLLGNPIPGGIFDKAMGPARSGSDCSTCFAVYPNCPGHFGHIELPLPVYNPIYFNEIYNILKMACCECFKSIIPKNSKYIFVGAMTLLRKGFVNEAFDLEEHFSKYATDGEISLKDSIDEYVSKVLILGDSDTKQFKGEEHFRLLLKSKLRHHRCTTCPNCKTRWKKVLKLHRKLLIPTKLVVANKHKKLQSKAIEQSAVSGYNVLLPSECKQYLINLYENERDFINELVPVIASSKEPNPTDIFFLSAIPVTPPSVRPISFTGNLECEHPQNKIYKGILDNIAIAKILINMINNSEDDTTLSGEKQYFIKRLNGKTNSDKFASVCDEIQTFVNAILDVDIKSNLQSIGLKQLIEKKAGIIRKNMMGKRVNYAARTVITPDPNLNINEIGVPEAFAKILTFPVPVTPWNVEELRKMVLNGPLVHPGANFLESEDGSYIRLFQNATSHREAIAKRLLTPGDVNGVKIVHRHLKNGDILLLNRQPTLHKPGIMAHSARILKGEKTFRLHYANCKAYNADFDGDEMNAHLPQNHIARTEGTNLVNVTQQYLVPKDGTPLSGLIQDYMVSGVKLTLRDTFFNKTDYMNLVYQGISSIGGDIITLPPCMLKPAVLWSGKQVLSTVIINVIPKGHFRINLESKSKIRHKAWIRGKEKQWKAGGTPFKSATCMTEAEVIIRDGELLNGVLDKMHYGATPYSLAHCVNELYGGDVATQLLSSFAKLFTAFLQCKGFTLGIKDILVVKKADKKRSSILQKARELGDAIVADIIDIPPNQSIQETLNEADMNDPKFRNVWDYAFKKALDSVTNAVNKICLPKGLLVPFPQNNLQLMVESGAKGSTVNTMQISCLLGQIELEGKRPPLMKSGKALPSFQPYDTSPRAGGFVDGRFLTGIKPQEFFFHCMAGREGLIDTAVKTSRSGYLQRCLVKHLEGLSVNYDMTVRDSDGSVVQFLYGEDGLEVTKCQFLKEHQIPFLIDNINAIYDAKLIELLKSSQNSKDMESMKKAIRRWKRKLKSGLTKSTPFIEFCKENLNDISSNIKGNKQLCSKSGRSPYLDKLVDMWNRLTPEEKRRYSKLAVKSPDTVTSKFKSHLHFGSLTEKLDEMIDTYMKTNNLQYEPEIIRDMVHLKVQRSLCEPGEPVGLLAAQSIGEPSTQMTLNTFHFAGRGEMNVTLGIPRLKEILMGKCELPTPTMEIPFNNEMDNTVKEHLRKEFTRMTMADVIEKIDVYKKLQFKPTRKLLYALKIHILPPTAYSDKTSLSPKQIAKFIGKTFSMKFDAFIQKSRKTKNDLIQEGKKEKESKQDSDSEGITKQQDFKIDDESSDSDASNTENEDAKHQSKTDKGEYEDDSDEEKQSNESGSEENVVDEQVLNDENNELTNREMTLNVSKCELDKVNYQWCLVHIVFDVSKMAMDLAGKLREFAAKSVISSIPGIRKAFLVTKDNGEVIFKTDGLNIEEIYKHGDKFNLNRLYTNDIHAISQNYGIEAATKALTKEVKEVFKVYGITVDPRHLSLIADYMTFYGTVRGLNRSGLIGHSSPLQQMSYESSLAVLQSTLFRSQNDNLMSPSARIVLGLPIALGTSCFDLMYSLTELST